jgi:hypothetical protein
MKTTGVVPEAFAASISLLSRSEMDPMPNPSRSQWKAIRLANRRRAQDLARAPVSASGRRSGAEAVARGWSVYGAERLQPVATGGKCGNVKNGSDSRKPLPWVAINCRSNAMVGGGRRFESVRGPCSSATVIWAKAILPFDGLVPIPLTATPSAPRSLIQTAPGWTAVEDNAFGAARPHWLDSPPGPHWIRAGAITTRPKPRSSSPAVPLACHIGTVYLGN